MANLNRQAISRMERDWSGLPESPKPPTPHHRLLTDLNIVGTGSLCQLFSTLATPLAWRRFFSNVLNSDGATVRIDRQGAVAALMPALDHRQRLYLATAEIRSDGRVEDQLLHWATAKEHAPKIPPRWSVVGLTVASVVTLAAVAVAGVPVTVLGGVLIVNLIVNLIYLPQIHQALEALERSGTTLRRYERMIDIVLTGAVDEPYLSQLLSPFYGTTPATTEIRRLQRLVNFADLRRSGMVYLLLQPFTMWSFHVFSGLLKWQQRVGHKIFVWMEALTEYELLATLAGLHYDNPGWCFPTIKVGHTDIQAIGLGHPLIADGVRVNNDITLGRTQPLLFITGSNMSGKSTLLRALGINILLAQMGGAVCAQRLVMPPVTLATCFNVQDALVAGRSFFMAELLCIRTAIDTLESARYVEGQQLVFLFDEILRGTNSLDRRIAVEMIIRRLLAADAIGIIATHDLELANKQPLRRRSQLMHFEDQIQIVKGKVLLQFDYRLREGIATTSNALMLLKAVGIDTTKER
uniref:MutS domain V n=1 Tax=Candidatus Kentrum sp. FW TaxID=2126338 RepID=A0A450U186_9GAMM|nr:MAG: MutS domain V [Candidatus Kentron sp. FW]